MLPVAASLALSVPAATAATEAFPGQNGWIAFSRTVSNGTSAIFVANPEGRGAHAWTVHSPPPGQPAWSPDAKTIAYAGELDERLYLMNVDTGEARRVPGRVRASGVTVPSVSWSPDSSRLVVAKRYGAGLAIVDPRTGKSRALTHGDDDQPAWSPTGTTIAFERGSDIYVVNVDGTHLRRLGVSGYLAAAEEPAWSPDGREIAFVENDALFVVSAAGGEPKQITSDPCGVRRPTWAPAARIAYETECNEYGRLVLVLPDGSAPRTLAVEGYAPSWAPDGRRIAYVNRRDDLRVVDTQTGADSRMLVPTAGDDSQPAWSSDGRSLAVTGYSGVDILDQNGRLARSVPQALFDPAWAPDGEHLVAQVSDCSCDIGIFDLRTGAVDEVIPDEVSGDRSACSPAWSPDGRLIAYARYGLPAGLGLYDVARRRARTLRFSGANPSWSPDGQRLAYDTQPPCGPGAFADERRASIFVAAANGTGRHRIARNATDPAWSPDGLRILFVRVVGRANEEIYVMNADGSHQRRLTRHPGADIEPDWQPRP
jgi:TolB protein